MTDQQPAAGVAASSSFPAGAIKLTSEAFKSTDAFLAVQFVATKFAVPRINMNVHDISEVNPALKKAAVVCFELGQMENQLNSAQNINVSQIDIDRVLKTFDSINKKSDAQMNAFSFHATEAKQITEQVKQADMTREAISNHLKELEVSVYQNIDSVLKTLNDTPVAEQMKKARSPQLSEQLENAEKELIAFKAKLDKFRNECTRIAQQQKTLFSKAFADLPVAYQASAKPSAESALQPR